MDSGVEEPSKLSDTGPGMIRAEKYCSLETERGGGSKDGLWIGWFACERHTLVLYECQLGLEGVVPRRSGQQGPRGQSLRDTENKKA